MVQNKHLEILHQPANRALWFTLAFHGGAINIAGFLAVHRFVSHVTGFSAYFSVNLVNGNYQLALFAVLVPCFFLLGSFFTGLISTSNKSHKKPNFAQVFGLLFIIYFAIATLGNMGTFGNFGEEFQNLGDFILLILLSFSMGSQNAIVTHYSSSVVRTTHLTGLTTDLGIGLAKVFNKTANAKDIKANHLRIGLVVSFLTGSIFGSIVFPILKFNAFFIFSISNLVIALKILFHKPVSSNK